MDLQLSDKVAVVTGASKGIGLAITRALAAEGARVVAGAREFKEDDAPPGARGRVEQVALDLSTPGGPPELVKRAVSMFGGLDIVVNNVGGVRPRTGGFLSLTDDDWIWGLNMNFLAAVRTTRAALPHLLERKAGSILTVCSVNASLPDPLVIDYSAAKAALLNFCKALSKEVGPKGVRVNTISPGPVSTGLWLGASGVAATVAQASGGSAGAVAQAAAAQSVTGRFTRPEEVADLVIFLASDRAGNVTGADFILDGGLTTSM
jgi:NAD(P)-dependent dehydrogenase (short-subunit alcohol dehydrogenase family)